MKNLNANLFFAEFRYLAEDLRDGQVNTQLERYIKALRADGRVGCWPNHPEMKHGQPQALN